MAEVTTEGEAPTVSNVLEADFEAKAEVNGEEGGEESKNGRGKRKSSKKGGFKNNFSRFMGLFGNITKQTQKPKKAEKVENEENAEPLKAEDKQEPDPTKVEKVDNVPIAEASLEKGEVSGSIEPEVIVKAETPALEEAPAAEVAPVQATFINPEVVEKAKEVDAVPEICPQADITPKIEANPIEAPTATDNQNSDDIGNLLEEAINHDPMESSLTETKKRVSGESFDKLDDVSQQSEKAKAKDSSSEEFIEVNQIQES